MQSFFSSLLVPCVLAVALASCVPLEPRLPRNAIKKVSAQTPLVLYKWNDDGGPGQVSIHIDRSTQRAFYSRGGRSIGWSYVATGKEGHRTPVGTFHISEMVVDKYSNRYGWIEDGEGNMIDYDARPSDDVPSGGHYVAAPMPYWMRLTSYGIGMHGGIIPNPGEAASHGCIRLPKPLAPLVFEAVREGARVTIE